MTQHALSPTLTILLDVPAPWVHPVFASLGGTSPSGVGPRRWLSYELRFVVDPICWHDGFDGGTCRGSAHSAQSGISALRHRFLQQCLTSLALLLQKRDRLVMAICHAHLTYEGRPSFSRAMFGMPLTECVLFLFSLIDMQKLLLDAEEPLPGS